MKMGAKEVAQSQEHMLLFAEDLGSVPINHMAAHKQQQLHFGDQTPSTDFHWHQACM